MAISASLGRRADDQQYEFSRPPLPQFVSSLLCRLIGSIENALRHVLTKDLPRRYESNFGSHLPATYTAHLFHRLPFRSETYSLSLHLPSSTPPLLQPSKSASSLPSLDNDHAAQASYCSLGDQPNKLQEWFLPCPVVVLSPDSYSGRILDEDEAHTLLSAGAAALSHLKLPWPVYIPVHDALRDAFRGFARQVVFSSAGSNGSDAGGNFMKNSSNATTLTNTSPGSMKNMPSPGGGTAQSSTYAKGSATASCGAVVRLESDSIHSNRSLPIEFCTLTGQLTMFVTRLRWHAPYAASLCSELAAGAADALERQNGNTKGYIEEQIEDQNLAAAAEALALSSSPSSKSLPPRNQQKRALSDNTAEENSKSSSDYSPLEEQLCVCWEMRHSYQLPLLGGSFTAADASNGETPSTRSQRSHNVATTPANNNDDDDDFELFIDTWDEDAVWRPWAAEDDPIERLEIDALWSIPLTTTTTIATAFQSSSLSSSSRLHTSVYGNINSNLVAAAVAIEQNSTICTTTGSMHSDNDGTKLPIQPASATAWRLAALRRDYQPDDGRRPLILLQAVDQRRQFLRLQSITEFPLEQHVSTTTTTTTTPSSSSSSPTPLSLQPPSDALPGATSFFSMLKTLLDQTPFIVHATDTAQLTSDDWWLQQGNYVPPLTQSCIIQDALRDIFQALSMPPTWPGTGMGLLSEQLNTLERFTETVPPVEIKAENTEVKKHTEVVGKGAPLNALFSRLSLHALRLGNPRAIAMLWTKFLRELRFAHWEANVPLPRMEIPSEQPTKIKNGCDDDTIDVDYCMTHQKLQLLDLSIRSKMQNQAENPTLQEHDHGDVDDVDNDDEAYASATETCDAIGTNPTLEGEKALHFLETLPPAAVYAELLAVGFASAVAILSRSPAAKLPAVAAQISRVQEVRNAWLNDHGVAVAGTGTINAAAVVGVGVGEAATTSSAVEETTTAHIISPSASSESNLSNASDITTSETDGELLQEHQDQIDGYSISTNLSLSPAVHAMIHSGLGIDGMKTLVELFGCVEQTVVAGQSVLQKLGDTHSECENFYTRGANALIAKALQHGSSSSSHYNGKRKEENSDHNDSNDGISSTYGTVINIDATDFALISSMVTGSKESQQQDRGQGNDINGGTAPWSLTPFWSEWCLRISKSSTPTPLHRLFIRKLPSELRVATVITSEMS